MKQLKPMEPTDPCGDVWQCIIRFLPTDQARIALARLHRTLNARAKAVMLERRQLVVGDDYTVRASLLARWPPLRFMQRIVIGALVLDQPDVFLQCPRLARVDLHIWRCERVTLRLPATASLAGSIDSDHHSITIHCGDAAPAVDVVHWQKDPGGEPHVVVALDGDDGEPFMEEWERKIEEDDAWEKFSSDPDWLYHQMALDHQETQHAPKRRRSNAVK